MALLDRYSDDTYPTILSHRKYRLISRELRDLIGMEHMVNWLRIGRWVVGRLRVTGLVIKSNRFTRPHIMAFHSLEF